MWLFISDDAVSPAPQTASFGVPDQAPSALIHTLSLYRRRGSVILRGSLRHGAI